MSLRLLPLVAVALLLCIAPSAGADPPQRLTWEELPQLVGKHVSIPLYNGGAVAGKILEVQGDALLIDVSKSTDPVAYPKGPLRVPRATLHVLELHGNAFKHRVAGTPNRRTTIQIIH
jgi:hypothetical protein